MPAEQGRFFNRTVLALVVLSLLLHQGPLRAFEDKEEPPHRSTRDLLEKLKNQESLYQHYSATVKVTQKFRNPDAGPGVRNVRRRRADDDAAKAVTPSIVSKTSFSQRSIKERSFRFVGEDVTTWSAGDPVKSERQAVFNGKQTIVLEKGNCTTLYIGRAEPPQMIPPHCWGMFFLGVNFPLSVYLEGTEKIASHLKAGQVQEGSNSTHDFYRVKAEIVAEQIVDQLDCTVIGVKRWFHKNEPPVHQYFWLAKDRNLHVALARTAIVQANKEIPQQEARVKSWRKLADEVWIPELVEVVDISPQAIATRTTEDVNQRLQIEAAAWQPEFDAATFESPEIPQDVPKFVIGFNGHLVRSPLQPNSVSPSQSTTLEAILDRLNQEQKRYESYDLQFDQRNVMLNSWQRVPDQIQATQSRQRRVILGDRQYLEDSTSSTNPGDLWSSINRQADDRWAQRIWTASTDQNSTIHSATIDYSRSRMKNIHLDPTLGLPFNWSKFLNTGWFDGNQKIAVSVEYLCDESISSGLCHKLKCDVKNHHFYLWLARDRSMLPVRKETYEPIWHPLLPTALSYVEDLQEISPGIWFPHRTCDLTFQKSSRDGLNMSRLILQSRIDTTFDRLTLDPVVDDRLFSEFLVPRERTSPCLTRTVFYLAATCKPMRGPWTRQRKNGRS